MFIDVDRMSGSWRIEDNFIIIKYYSQNLKFNLKQAVKLLNPEDGINKGITFYCNNAEIRLGSKCSEYDEKTLIQIREYIKNIILHNEEDTFKLLSNYPLGVDKNYVNIPFYKIDVKVIAEDILFKLKNNQIIINDSSKELYAFWYRLILSSKEKERLQRASTFIDTILNGSISLCHDFAKSSGFNNYGVTKIIESSNPNFKSGEYFYNFCDNGNLAFIELPLTTFELHDIFKSSTKNSISTFFLKIYNPRLKVDKPFIITNEMIFDFDLDGNQVSLTKSSNGEEPELIKTMFSELLFGSSYATIHGFSSNMPKIESKIEDLRTIQIIFNDNSDIRLQGISIYYDLKRYIGNLKNKRVNKIETDVKTNSNASNSSNLAKQVEELKMLKELLDMNIITQEEFDLKKKSILGI